MDSGLSHRLRELTFPSAQSSNCPCKKDAASTESKDIAEGTKKKATEYAIFGRCEYVQESGWPAGATRASCKASALRATLGLRGDRECTVRNHFVWKNDTLQENGEYMKSLLVYPTVGFIKISDNAFSFMES